MNICEHVDVLSGVSMHKECVEFAEILSAGMSHRMMRP